MPGAAWTPRSREPHFLSITLVSKGAIQVNIHPYTTISWYKKRLYFYCKTISQAKLSTRDGLRSAELGAALSLDEGEDHVFELEQVDPLRGFRF